jgi:hypothetical protein
MLDPESDPIGALIKMKGLDSSESPTKGVDEQNPEGEQSSDTNSSTKKDEQN